jgi:hypothetical protein
MKKYRVLLPHSWTERPGGGHIHGVPGEMAVISDEVFAAAPPGTFALLPGEEGFVPPAVPFFTGANTITPEPDSEPITVVEAGEFKPVGPDKVVQPRIAKAEAFVPKLKRETDPFDHDRNGKPGGSLPKAKRGKRK